MSPLKPQIAGLPKNLQYCDLSHTPVRARGTKLKAIKASEGAVITSLAGPAHAVLRNALDISRRMVEGKPQSFADAAARVAANDPAVELVDGEPQFRLFVAGARGSGKTVFLASLHNLLSVPTKDNFFHATLTSDASADYLSRNFDVIRDPKKTWPPGTPDTMEYVFRCLYSSTATKETFPLFRFHYMDFPGGALTQPGEHLSINIKETISQAHTVAFLIDGQKILDGLNGRTTEGFSVNDDLDKISERAMGCIWKPTQFIVTKWDLLRGHSLSEIRRFLLLHRKFAAIVRKRRESKEPTYLIPVSAVGRDFAFYDRVKKVMRKRPNAVPEPYNLDITLALAIADTLKKKIEAALYGQKLLGTGLLKAVVNAGEFANWLTKIGTMITGDPWMGVVMLILGGASGRISSLAEETDRRLSAIKDQKSALDNIAYLQHARVQEFLSEFPAADLLCRLEE